MQKSNVLVRQGEELNRVQLVVETSELAIKQDVTATEIHTLKHKVSRKRDQLANLKKYNSYRY